MCEGKKLRWKPPKRLGLGDDVGETLENSAGGNGDDQGKDLDIGHDETIDKTQ